ncbi:hypothetical protein SCHPADRAFT_711389 [Schizopora paradoxa]|uniref:Uncharacterized protein n=1 Tax=Schizopora paradoxa TaxID=27342 RepID=A0A0H2R383_9AGAM|nr:hypothetical protein SCHPADRAFT_711389 [Schizopora paradoxa]
MSFDRAAWSSSRCWQMRPRIACGRPPSSDASTAQFTGGPRILDDDQCGEGARGVSKIRFTPSVLIFGVLLGMKSTEVISN